MLERMRTHIATVVGRYKGKIRGWDVVNEALNDDGTLRDSPWHRGIGDDYIAKAFEFAREADPGAELYYNDYNLATRPAKRAGAIRIIKELQQRGLRIDAVGEQGHWRLESPTTAEIDQTITELRATGVKVMITELDVNLLPPAGRRRLVSLRAPEANPYVNGLPDDVQQALARCYADAFRVFLKHRDDITRVTFWGVSDGDSWLNRGRMNHPLLWDRQRQPKPAFDGSGEGAHDEDVTRRRPAMRRTVWLLLLGILLPLAAAAQETRGNISGTVRDAQGVVPGASVKITNVDTQGRARTSSPTTPATSRRRCSIPATTKSTVQMPGFKSATRNDIALGVGQQLTVPFTLEVGEISEEIVVRAETPLLDTNSVSSGANFDTPSGREPADVLEHADHAVALLAGRQRQRCADAGVAGLRRQHVAVGGLRCSACRWPARRTRSRRRSAATTTRSTAPTTTAATAASPRRPTPT